MADRTDRSRLSSIDRLSEAINNLQKSLACTICLELMTEPTKTRCGHSFCKSCIGSVIRRKNSCCPLCKKSLNRRNISKDDHVQICIEKFKILVDAIHNDSHIDILSHLKQPRDTKESYYCSDTEQSKKTIQEKSFKEERSLVVELNRIDEPSTSRATMIHCNNPHFDASHKKSTLSRRTCAHSDDKNDNAIHNPDIKVRMWLHSFPDKLNTVKNETPFEDKARPMNPISDDNSESDEIDVVYRDGIDASRRSSQDRKRSTDSPKRIDEDDTLSQVNKGAKQIEADEVIKIHSSSSELKYNESHARIRGKKSREEIARSKLDIGERVNRDNSSSSTTAYDRIGTSAIAQQSTANWSRVIEFGKEMKRGRKRKVKKLNVSTEKNRNPPRIVENIELSQNSKYDLARIAATSNKREREANRLESDDRKQNTIDKSLDLSNAKVKSLSETNDQTELFDKNEIGSNDSTPTMLDSSYITLEEGRKIRILNLNNDQMNNIIGFQNTAGNSQCSQNRYDEENAADDRNSLLLSQKVLTVLTPEKLSESIHKVTHDVSQTSADNFRSSSCLPTEKRIPGPRETSNVQRTSSRTALTPNKGRLTLKRKMEIDSPTLSKPPLSEGLTITQENIDDGKNVHSPVSMDSELFNRLKVVRRDLNEIIFEDRQQTDQDTVSANTPLENKLEVENNNGNVSGIRQDRKFGHKFTDESTMSKGFVSKESRSVEYKKHQSLVKFMQRGSLIERHNRVEFFYLGSIRRKSSMPAFATQERRAISICNMRQSISRFEMDAATFFNPYYDSSNANNNTVTENISLNNSNQAVSQEFPVISSICKASATSTPKRYTSSHLNREKSATIYVYSSNESQRSDKSIENVVKESPFHKISCADKSAIHATILHTHPGTSKPIKLLSPDKDSQLKFLHIDSPMNRHEKLKHASSIKSDIKGNNFSEMKSSRLVASKLSEAQEPPIESLRTKRKRMTCDRELFEDKSNDEDDDSSDAVSDTTIKLDRYSKLSVKANSSRLDVNKKRRIHSSFSSFSSDDVVQIVPVSKRQNAPGKKLETSNSDTESESAIHVTKNSKSSDQCTQRNALMDTATKQHLTEQDSYKPRIRKIIDKWREYEATQRRTSRDSNDSQNNVKSIRNPSKEDSAGHQSSCSNNVLKESSQKSFAKESNMFESDSFFNYENLDYVLQQLPNADDTSKKLVNSCNDDIINRVLQIDRSRSNPGACRPPGSIPQNDITSQREKDNREFLLQDNFDEIIANITPPQSEDFIPCSAQPDRNSNHPLAKQKTSNCLAMTNESCGAMQETPIVPPSSTNDMFESPRNVRKSSTTNNVISRNSDKENVVCNQKKHSYANDQKDIKDATADADAIDKDSRKKIASKHNMSQEKDKFLEEHGASIQSADWLHVDDDETRRALIASNSRSNSKDDTFEHDSRINITQHQVQLKMFEKDLFDFAARNQTEAAKEQRTPKRRKQNIQDENMEPGEHSDEDDVVENTPQKKMKNNRTNVKTIESRENAKVRYLTPISRISDTTPSILGQSQRAHSFGSGASTPTSLFEMCPSKHSTPIIPRANSINSPDTFERSKRIERIDIGRISLAKQIVATTPVNIRRQPEKRNLCFVCSGLLAVQIAVVKEFAAKHNANYVNQFDCNVTHVIVRTTGEQNTAKSTLKYVQGIVHQKWIVSYKWIEDCMSQQKLLDEVPYEATTYNESGINGAGPCNSRLREKGLFEGFTFLCVGPYHDVSQNQYEDLLRATGATVVESLDILAGMGGMKGIVIQYNIHDDKILKSWYRTAKAGPIITEWIVECIGRYKLCKLASYIQYFSPQDFCAIGYPRELVEEDEEYNDDE